MKTIYILLSIMLILCLLSSHKLSAQNETYKYNIAVQPLYLVNGGLRIDFEKQIKPKHWLQLSAKGYYLQSNGDNYNYDRWETLLTDDDYDVTELKGAGIELNYKRFLLPKTDLIYLSGGLSYSYFTVDYKGYNYFKYTEDGMDFYERHFEEMSQYFNKLGANICFGMQTSAHRRFFVDGYVGLGYSYSFYNDDKHAFNKHAYSVGHRGLLFITGLRVGLRFGKIKQHVDN